jgi:SDR family mycofactocin-dependent oxidoreductase
VGRFDGKVVLISGGARGQGRSHAVLMAEEGADIITFDICGQVASVEYPMATPEDLQDTVHLVEKTGRRIVARQADVRDCDAVSEVVQEGVAELGQIDFVIANAGILAASGPQSEDRQAFYDSVDIMLTGVFHTCEAAIPGMIKRDAGGAVIIVSSTAGLRGLAVPGRFPSPGLLGYTSAKHAIVGLMRSYANALAPHNIRCNTVHPTGVDTPMVVNEAFRRLNEETPELAARLMNPLPVELLDPSDVTKSIMFLCSDDGKYITGTTLTVDAGTCNR